MALLQLMTFFLCACSDGLEEQWDIRVAEERAFLEEKHSKDMQVKLQDILLLHFGSHLLLI